MEKKTMFAPWDPDAIGLRPADRSRSGPFGTPSHSKGREGCCLRLSIWTQRLRVYGSFPPGGRSHRLGAVMQDRTMGLSR